MLTWKHWKVGIGLQKRDTLSLTEGNARFTEVPSTEGGCPEGQHIPVVFWPGCQGVRNCPWLLLSICGVRFCRRVAEIPTSGSHTNYWERRAEECVESRPGALWPLSQSVLCVWPWRALHWPLSRGRLQALQCPKHLSWPSQSVPVTPVSALQTAWSCDIARETVSLSAIVEGVDSGNSEEWS